MFFFYQFKVVIFLFVCVCVFYVYVPTIWTLYNSREVCAPLGTHGGERRVGLGKHPHQGDFVGELVDEVACHMNTAVYFSYDVTY